MFCTQCGSINPDQARFCHKCGNSIWLAQVSKTPIEPVGLNDSPSIALRKSTQNKAQKQDGAKKGVKGWLLFLCISLTILSPLFVLGQIFMEWTATEPYFVDYPGLEDAVVLQIACLLGLIGFSIYAGSELWNVRMGAVKVAKNYFWTLLIYSLVSPFVFFAIADLPSAANTVIAKEAIMNALRGMLAFAVWFTYLSISKRVRATYPTPETHVRCPDCRQLIQKEACLCEHCGCKLIPK